LSQAVEVDLGVLRTRRIVPVAELAVPWRVGLEQVQDLDVERVDRLRVRHLAVRAADLLETNVEWQPAWLARLTPRHEACSVCALSRAVTMDPPRF
jgi:hypothetical protein